MKMSKKSDIPSALGVKPKVGIKKKKNVKSESTDSFFMPKTY